MTHSQVCYRVNETVMRCVTEIHENDYSAITLPVVAVTALIIVVLWYIASYWWD